MTEYERPSFDQEWWDKVSNYLEEHPEEGFEEDQVKEFIKYITNRYINGSLGMNQEELEELVEDLRSQ